MSDEVADVLIVRADPVGLTLDGEHEAGRSVAEDAARRYGARVRPLVVTRNATAQAGEATLLDGLGAAHDRYGASAAALYLIRPDTVVAGRAPLAGWPRLTRHLATIFVGSADDGQD